MFHAFLNLNKPRGMTSHDVVARVRALTGQRRVGHAGTLDPLADGVLPIALGRATRLVDRVGEGEKTYRARVCLGVTTTTDDTEGEVVRRAEVPPLSASDLEAALDRFRGEIEQVPPAFSAIKVQGQRAYRAARRGEAVELAPRRVTVYELRLLEWSSPVLAILVRCSRGTYIRSLARDLGQALGVGGHLAALTRVAVGPFHLDWALSLEDLAARAASGELERVLVAPDLVLLDLPALVVAPEREADFRHGRSWAGDPAVPPDLKGLARAYTPDGRLLGLMDYDSSDGRWRPRLALVD
ncbi:MAG: tRNA pseudouridine(55) synthase TruB [Chloroflexi bacterium]|nr:tRNA pseudouridine(55) synthase TruB [Chloroflexota bacterium]